MVGAFEDVGIGQFYGHVANGFPPDVNIQFFCIVSEVMSEVVAVGFEGSCRDKMFETESVGDGIFKSPEKIRNKITDSETGFEAGEVVFVFDIYTVDGQFIEEKGAVEVEVVNVFGGDVEVHHGVHVLDV